MITVLRALARRKLTVAALGTLLLVLCAVVLVACSQTPTEVPVRTFERAQRMDVACLRLYEPVGDAGAFASREPIGRPQNECAPVPVNVDGAGFIKQLFAFVTQTQRGELAVVNLSVGALVDQSRGTPGINFFPVGAQPTDVAATPDGKMVFVASAETNKPAIYGIPTRRLLGDNPDFKHDPDPVTLASWPVCALPQSPGAITVVPRAGAARDAGAGPAYDLVVVLPGDRLNSAKVLTLDPRPFRRAGLAKDAAGNPDYASDVSDGDTATLDVGPVLEPGQLRPCADYQISAVELTGSSSVPTSFAPGPKWDDGVKYVDGGVDLTCARPASAPTCGAGPCCAVTPVPLADGGAREAGADASAGVDAGACTPLGPQDAGTIPLDVGPLDPPRLVSLVRADQILYIADEGAPFIHVLDVSTPSAPRELPPLLATSLANPSRAVKVKDLALSPPTREYKRFLYAVDRTDGSLMIYDVTDPLSAQRTPLLRPHPELNPFQPADRLGFSSPVVAVAFARHDTPLASISGVPTTNTASGALCNPNPRVEQEVVASGQPRSDLGYYYRADIADPNQVIGPRRLRGIFAFATLASGQVVTIDVDDWDAPCRRPFDMKTASALSDLAVPEPDLGDKNAYHAPLVTLGAVTNESFFPVSSPHSQRSSVLITSDTVSGNQVPRVLSAPSLTSSAGVVFPQVGPGSEDTPLLDIRFSFDQPQAHTDQDWAIGYEPVIPGFDGLSATVSTKNGYQSLVLEQAQARFCMKGVEDWSRGTDRINQVNAELARRGTNLPPGTDRQTADYVQLTEDLLDVNDPYWALTPNEESAPGQVCWEGTLANASGATRHDTCERIFGAYGVDQKPSRDFPIVEAFDDHVVLGRFNTSANGVREVRNAEATNAPDLKLMQCCFHRQVAFHVRTGKLWGAVGRTVGGGPGVGFFSHLTTDNDGRCVSSCDPRESLLNARLPTLPSGVVSADVGRNSPLALRNPMFVAVMVGASSGKEPVRDMIYNFSSRGQFQTLAIGIAGTSISVSPQSMRYVDALGQMAVVDGASQGLVLIDLAAVTVARAPYF